MNTKFVKWTMVSMCSASLLSVIPTTSLLPSQTVMAAEKSSISNHSIPKTYHNRLVNFLTRLKQPDGTYHSVMNYLNYIPTSNKSITYDGHFSNIPTGLKIINQDKFPVTIQNDTDESTTVYLDYERIYNDTKVDKNQKESVVVNYVDIDSGKTVHSQTLHGYKGQKLAMKYELPKGYYYIWGNNSNNMKYNSAYFLANSEFTFAQKNPDISIPIAKDHNTNGEYEATIHYMDAKTFTPLKTQKFYGKKNSTVNIPWQYPTVDLYKENIASDNYQYVSKKEFLNDVKTNPSSMSMFMSYSFDKPTRDLYVLVKGADVDEQVKDINHNPVSEAANHAPVQPVKKSVHQIQQVAQKPDDPLANPTSPVDPNANKGTIEQKEKTTETPSTSVKKSDKTPSTSIDEPSVQEEEMPDTSEKTKKDNKSLAKTKTIPKTDRKNISHNSPIKTKASHQHRKVVHQHRLDKVLPQTNEGRSILAIIGAGIVAVAVFAGIKLRKKN